MFCCFCWHGAVTILNISNLAIVLEVSKSNIMEITNLTKLYLFFSFAMSVFKVYPQRQHRKRGFTSFKLWNTFPREELFGDEFLPIWREKKLNNKKKTARKLRCIGFMCWLLIVIVCWFCLCFCWLVVLANERILVLPKKKNLPIIYTFWKFP